MSYLVADLWLFAYNNSQTVRRDFIVPVNKERKEMVGNVILFFSVLSSAFILKKPLPPYLPPAEACRQRLVDALKELTIVKERRVSSSRQLLYFAYALMMSTWVIYPGFVR
jgi:hypothetical protein